MTSERIALPEEKNLPKLGIGVFLREIHARTTIVFEKESLTGKIFLIAALAFVWSAIIFLSTTFGAFLWHKMAPAGWHFLQQGQVGEIQNLFLGIASLWIFFSVLKFLLKIINKNTS